MRMGRGVGVCVIALTFGSGIGCGNGSQGVASDASMDGAPVHPVEGRRRR
jgi:hypothetical protein